MSASKLSFADGLGILHEDLFDGTLDAGADQADMPIDLSIVGVFVGRYIAPSRYRDCRRDEK